MPANFADDGIVTPRERHRENLRRGIGQAKKVESRVVREHAAREAVLSDHVLVLPGVGRAVKAPFDPHKLPARYGISKLAVLDTARGGGSCRDKSVVFNCYVMDNTRVATSELSCYKLNVIVAWFGIDGE